MATTNPVRRIRRRWKALVAALLALITVIAAIPWALGTAPARRWLLSRANLVLAPAELECSTIRFSWFRPTELTDFVIRDAQGDPVVAAPGATWDRNLRQIVFDRPRYGTFDLKRAKLDVERREDGTIDLYEAIKPILGKNPRTELRITFQKARLRFRDASQPNPVTAEEADLTLDVAASPRPLTWMLKLRNRELASSGSLEVGGRFDRWKSPSSVAVDLKARLWPWALSGAGLESTGQLDGRIALHAKAGDWSVSGDAGLLHLDVAGARLAGDHLRLDQVSSSWSLSGTAAGWEIHRLDLDSPLGSIKASGQRPRSARTVAKVEGTLDLAALARHLPHALNLREGITLDRGSAQVRIESSDAPDEKVPGWSVEARVSDLEARDRERRFTLREPATLSARLTPQDKGLALEQLSLNSTFLNATGQGDLVRGVDWSGRFDLGALQRQLRELIDFGAIELAGQGQLSGRYQQSETGFQGTLTSDLRDLKLAGLATGPLQRDRAHLDLAVEGKTQLSGLPSSWNTLRLNLTSGTTSVRVDVDTRAAAHATHLSLAANTPIPGSDPPRRAKGFLDAQWGTTGLAIDRLSVSLLPIAEEAKTKPEANGEQLLLNTKGRYDREAGELTLTPAGLPSSPSPIALAPEGIKVTGLGANGALRATVGLVGELEAVSQLMAPGGAPNSAAGPTGPWTARGTAESTEDGLRFVGRLDVHPKWITPETGQVVSDEGPIAVALNVLAPTNSPHLEVAEIGLISRYATIEGSGRLNESGGRRVVDLRGTLTPRWDAITNMLAERIEPKAKVGGKPRAWRIQGPVAGGSPTEILKSIDAELGLELTEADIYGLHLGPVPLVLRTKEGGLAIDVIDTTLNGGRVHLEPELILDAESGSQLRLDERSSIANAEINDEVSTRFLSYVAPVLDRATRAHGRVSVNLNEAEFPIGGGGDGSEKREAKVDGKVVFQNVEFLPGPFVNQFYDLLGRTERPSIKLDKPVALTIADRRVYQKGLALPLGQVTQLELEGWVDFDRNLQLTASLPITAAMVGNAPVLSALVERQRISVPIRGTLGKPEIDREAVSHSLKDLGESVLTNGAVRGAADLFMRLRRPRDPNAPSPPTFQERRAKRAERRAERRRRNGLEP